MFCVCFNCKHFRCSGYWVGCEIGKYNKIGILTVEPHFFVRNCKEIPSVNKRNLYEDCLHIVRECLKTFRQEYENVIKKKQVERVGLLLNEKWFTKKSQEIDKQSRQERS